MKSYVITNLTENMKDAVVATLKDWLVTDYAVYRNYHKLYDITAILCPTDAEILEKLLVKEGV